MIVFCRWVPIVNTISNHLPLVHNTLPLTKFASIDIEVYRPDEILDTPNLSGRITCHTCLLTLVLWLHISFGWIVVPLLPGTKWL